MTSDTDALFKGYLFRYFMETGNPIFVWKMIRDCIEAKESFPLWVMQYLYDCSGRLADPANKSASDVRGRLPEVFGFELTVGRGNPLRQLDDHLKDAPLAAAFMIAILRGDAPKAARDQALNETDSLGEADDKTVRVRLMKFFNVASSPKENFEWRQIILLWIFKNPVYYQSMCDRFPELPPSLFLLMNQGEVLECTDITIYHEPASDDELRREGYDIPRASYEIKDGRLCIPDDDDDKSTG